MHCWFQVGCQGPKVRWVDVHPRKESSTKASPSVLMVTSLLADWKFILGVLVSRESVIRQKRRSQRKGPGVEPWSGPNRGVVSMFL